MFSRRAGIAFLTLAATVAGALVAGGAGAGSPSGTGPNIAGNLTRGSGNELTLTLNNAGAQGYDFFRFALNNSSAEVVGLQVGQAPPGTQCQIFGRGGNCSFQNQWSPGQPLVIVVETQAGYPDNGGALGFACPNPCAGTDEGPFSFPGPGPVGSGTTIPPGYDLFETDPANTIFRFEDQFTIPAGFFGPGSEPFSGPVNFGGIPIGTFMGNGIGDADTIVQRPNAAQLPDEGAGNPIPIELVALNLVSVEPITVGNGGGPESFFDVFVDLSGLRQSQGQMTITKDGEQGGGFQSQLQVFPKFTFTPVGGGEPKVLDVGALPPDAARDNELILNQQGGVWRAGCAPPALHVQGLNDLFCPGQPPGGGKKLTVEQAALARHGVYPVQPTLEHFQCYQAKQRRNFKPVTVQVNDQFARRRLKLRRHQELCNPVRKNKEPFDNRQAHLECYEAGRRQPQLVAIRNQFGSQRLETTSARSLCVPSLKFKRRPPRGDVTLTDHFQCYDVKRNQFDKRRVNLNDQFGSARVKVKRAIWLCNPAAVEGDPLDHPVRHLVCYAINKRKNRERVKVRNEFGRAQKIVAKKPVSLCVPSLKLDLGKP